MQCRGDVSMRHRHERGLPGGGTGATRWRREERTPVGSAGTRGGGWLVICRATAQGSVVQSGEFAFARVPMATGP